MKISPTAHLTIDNVVTGSLVKVRYFSYTDPGIKIGLAEVLERYCFNRRGLDITYCIEARILETGRVLRVNKGDFEVATPDEVVKWRLKNK